MNKILIFDDEEDFQGNLRKHLERLAFLEANFEISTPDNEEFRAWMDVLGKRQREFRKTGTWGGEPIPLDDVAIFVVDYDLFDTIPFLTAENIAYLARCFSKCGLIVGVNQYGHNTFDLTLKGHPESFADLNVGQEQLHNPNLWGGTALGFHPWHWPVLPDHLEDFEKKVEGIRESLKENPKDDIPIWQVLGFSPEKFDVLPRSIAQFLGREPAKATFRRFVRESGNGLRLKDARNVNDDVLARVGVARLSKWLERLVLPEQDILVDAPHLVSRYPSLLADESAGIEIWNATARRMRYDELGLSEIIEPSRFKKDHWLSRPVWFWDELRECEDILEVREPWKVKRPNWVFCEDASQFYEKGYREFVADTESPFSRRFVRMFEGVKYRPIPRFAL